MVLQQLADAFQHFAQTFDLGAAAHFDADGGGLVVIRELGPDEDVGLQPEEDAFDGVVGLLLKSEVEGRFRLRLGGVAGPVADGFRFYFVGHCWSLLLRLVIGLAGAGCLTPAGWRGSS